MSMESASAVTNVPGAVWTLFGVVWGSLISLITAKLSERWSVARAKAQREHESEEKSRERTMALRREVYLPAASEYNEALKFLATMPTHTVEEIGKSEPLGKFTSSAGKLSLVSDQETAVAVHKLSVECGALYVRFAPMAVEISAIRGVADVHTKLREKHLAEIERVSQASGAILESGERDDARFAGLQRRYEILDRLFKQEGEKLASVNRKAAELHKNYALQFLPAMKVLLDLGVEMVIHMRRDLGQGGNADFFAKEAREAAKRMYAVAEAALQKF